MSTYAEKLAQLQQMRAELRKLEVQAEREALRMRPLTIDDETRMRNMQVRADSAYVAANRKAPPPHAYERPAEYRRRLLEGLKVYSPKWRESDISSLADEVLPIAENQVFADAVANGRTHGLKPGEIRARKSVSAGGHTVTEYDGVDASFIQQFQRVPQHVALLSRDDYARMSRDANAARIEQIVRGYQRPMVQAPQAAF